MKGIIIYSSKTGNTKRAAEYLEENLKNSFSLELASVEEEIKLENYDFALIGGWIDRGMPDAKAKKLIQSTGQTNLGIFVTLGAMPDSEHGLKVKKNLEELLEGKNSLGEVRLPGSVDPKLTKRMGSIPAKVIPKHIREQMVEAGKNSREATEEELKEAAEFLKKS